MFAAGPALLQCVVKCLPPAQLCYSSSGLSFVVDDTEDAGNLADSCVVLSDAASRSATSLQ